MPAAMRRLPSGSSTQLCASSLRLATMIWSRICRWTVRFSIGTSVSIRRSRLRGIQSADEMNTSASRDGSVWPLPKQMIRACSRKRPTMLDPDVLRQAGDARPQAADAADHEVDADTGPRAFVQLIDDRGIDQRVQLDPDSRRFAGAGEGDLLRSINSTSRLRRVRVIASASAPKAARTRS